LNKEYLKDVPKNKEWIEKREAFWYGHGEEQGLVHKLFKFKDDPVHEKEAFKKYFFEGDVQEFIKTGKRVHVGHILDFSPVQTFDSMRFVISSAVRWLARREKKNEGELEKQLTIKFNNIVSGWNSRYWPKQVTLDCFFYFFGNQYEAKRPVTLTEGPKPYILSFQPDVNSVCIQLLSGIRKHVWGSESDGDKSMFKELIPYFLNIYPLMNAKCYSKTIPPRSAFKIGESIGLQNHTHPRWLIASLHGIVTEWDTDDNYDPLPALKVNDPEALEQLKSGMKKITMPEEYYELEKLVLELGEDCLSY